MTSTPRAASFTSLDWIFLPRYSGVRPTISPPMNTVMMANSKMEYRPVPTPPGDDLAEHHAGQDREPAHRRVGVLGRVHAPVDVCVDAVA